MSSDEKLFPDWLPMLAVLAAAIAFIVADPAGLASGFAAHEFGAFRALHATAIPLRLVNSIPAQVLLLETVGAALLLLIAARQFTWAFFVAVGTMVAAQLSSWLLYVHLGALFDTANASLSVLLTVIAGLFSQASRKPEPRTRAAVARPAAQAEPAAAETAPPRPAPAGETLALTSLSCGLRRASVLARFHDADATGFMRLAESVMAPLIQDLAAHGAWINRFDGTSFSAQWPAAENDAHADAACDAAGRLILAIATANEGLAQQWPQGNGPGGSPIPALEIGIGLATGACLVGAIRAGSHIGLCAVAESGVTAERMGLISERYGSAAIASDTVCAAVQRAHAFLEADFLVLDPGSAPVRLYALLGNALVRANPKFRAVATFHEHIFHSIRTRQWEKARALIAQCRKISGANPKLYDLHLSRIAWYEANPPPPDWDGAFRQPLR